MKKFEEHEPEVVFEWHDGPTDAKGWVVINSLRGGAIKANEHWQDV